VSIFSRKDSAEITPTITGTDVLRKCVKARNSKPRALKAIAREVEGLGTGTLEDFGNGKAELSVEKLQALTKVLFPHAEFDVATGLLTSSNKTPPRGYIAPPRFDPKSSPYYFKHDPNAPARAPQPVVPEKQKVKTSRPGWLGGWT
jgi:hypothetical protein